MTLRLGVSSGAFYPALATEDTPDAAARLGFSDLELMLQTPSEYDPGFLSDVHARANAVGVEIVSHHLFQRLHPLYSGYQRRTDEALDLMRRAFDTAAQLGVPTLVFHGAARDEVRGVDAWNQFLMMIGRIGRIAAEYQVVVAVENVSWCVVSSVRDVQRLAAALPNLAPAGSLGFTFDSFQALEADANAFMLLAAMGPHVRHIHISDGRRGDGSFRHLLPGQGDLPWSALIRAIGQTLYRGPLIIEAPLPDDPGLAATRALLEPLLAIANGPANDDPTRLPDGVVEGIRLFNAGEFYECHEVIEHEWHAERGDIRRLYQGILQIGVGLHHARSGNQRGAVLLLSDGIDKTSDFLPEALGVDTAFLVLGARACLDEVERLGPDHIDDFDWTLVPVITIKQPD